MVNRKSWLILLALGMAGGALAQTTINKTPAAKVHAREEGGGYVRYTSKLATVLELNFTFGFDHTAGKKSIGDMLTKIATDYTVDGKAPFTVKKFTGPNSGGGNGLPTPTFTLTDLNGAEVYITNNISSLDQLPGKNAAMGTAFESAVKGGKSVLGFHGSGDGGGGWKFYNEELHPVLYGQHGNRTPAPIYKNEPESSHVVLQGILATGTKKDVPMGTDASGKEVLKNVTTRDMTNEWYRFGRNLITDSKYGPLTTCLLKYDYRQVSTADLANQYRYAGGNPYLWMVKISQGRAAYFPPGHDATETTQGATSFDGNTGDFERIYAQMLFYLAGYTKEPCGGAVDCAGLPVVDASDRMTGKTVSTTSIAFDSQFKFRTLSDKPYTAKLTDVRGRLVAIKNGKGKEAFEFKHSNLKPGVYFMSVQVGKEAPVVQRFMVNPVSI
jgi:hypothetical protein